jgi:enterochelin esterase-like enzyme
MQTKSAILAESSEAIGSAGYVKGWEAFAAGGTSMRQIRQSISIFAIILSILAGWATALSGGTGQVVEDLSFKSELLSRKVDFAVYLPPDYDISQRRYPVVYLLHGFTDDESAWIQFGEVNRAADIGIASGAVPPLIIVMPDAGVTWYINDHRGEESYEEMFVSELIPHIDTTFRTRPDREFRTVSGLSMGGFGSLLLAMRHPELFGSCAAFSSAVHTDEEIVAMDDERYDELFTDLFGSRLRGEARLTAHFKEYSPLHLARRVPSEKLKEVRWYIDCGDDDFLYKGNAALHVLLRDLEIPHEFRVRDGAHNWTYWRTWIGEGLRFIGAGFHR